MPTDAPHPLVLVIEDDREMRELVCYILEEAGFVTHQLEDGTRAVDLAAARRPALVLLDVMMPGVDGYTAASQLRQDPRTRHIPIVFVTAESGPVYRTLSLGVGAQAHVTKPFVAEQLVRIVNHVVAGASPEGRAGRDATDARPDGGSR